MGARALDLVALERELRGHQRGGRPPSLTLTQTRSCRLCPNPVAGHLWRCMQRSPILFGLWLLVASTGLGTAVAAPSDSSKRTVTNVDSIRRFMEKGQSLFVAGQYQRAAEVFETGYELHPYSAFLFNAGVALEKSGKLTEAIDHFKKYLEVDPKAPDAPDVTKRIAKVEQALKDQALSGAAKSQSRPSSTAPGDVDVSTKSLVIVETEPPGAPLRILRRIRGASVFDIEGENPDWAEVFATESPANASLDVGQYHVQVEKYQD